MSLEIITEQTNYLEEAANSDKKTDEIKNCEKLLKKGLDKILELKTLQPLFSEKDRALKKQKM